MLENSDLSIEQFIASLEAAARRSHMLRAFQTRLICLSEVAVIGDALMVVGEPSRLVNSLCLVAMLFRLGSLIPGRMAERIESEVDSFLRISEQELARRNSGQHTLGSPV